jgi:hypothetical protein
MLKALTALRGGNGLEVLIDDVCDRTVRRSLECRTFFPKAA